MPPTSTPKRYISTAADDFQTHEFIELHKSHEGNFMTPLRLKCFLSIVHGVSLKNGKFKNVLIVTSVNILDYTFNTLNLGYATFI